MTTDALSSILEAELQTGQALAETLDRQRQALVARDLERIIELTGTLEGQMEHFRTLVVVRMESLSHFDGELSEACASLLQRTRQMEGRVLRLSELNQDLIADRLAYVNAMLSTIGLTGAAGYGSAGDAAQHRSALSRSA